MHIRIRFISIALLVLLSLALAVAPAHAQWTNVDNEYWTTAISCRGRADSQCTVFEGNFFAYSGEQVVIHFDPYSASWWDRWDVNVYVHGGGANYEQRRHNNGSRERIFFFGISQTREFGFSIALSNRNDRPGGNADIRVEINSRNPGQRQAPTDTPERMRYIYDGDRLRGRIDSGNRDDYFLFSARRDQRVTITMNRDSGDLDPLLELQDSDGNQIASDDDGGSGNNARISRFRIPYSGDYKIRARRYGSSSAGGYTLSLDIDRPTATPRPRTKYYLDRNDRVEGDLYSGNREDRFEFSARSGDRVTISMNRISGDLDPYLELHDSRGNRVASDDDGGSGNNALINNYRVDRSGDFIIVARRYSSSTSGRYRLTLDVTRPRPTDTPVPRYRGDIYADRSCSLHDAIRAANRDRSVGSCAAGRGADTIVLQTDARLWATLPRIESTITIEGGGNTISGDGRYRIFEVARGASLTVRNVTIADGYAADDGTLNLVGDGGAILNEGTLRLEDCRVRNNRSGEDGGVIRNLGSATIVDCGFSNNRADRQGGAIYSSDGGDQETDSASLTIIRSSFGDNSAQRHAGAVFAGGNASIDRSSFTGNRAQVSGGAIYNLGAMSIGNSVFSRNSSQKNGGAVFNDYLSTVTVGGSEFNSNTTRDGGGGLMSYARASARVNDSEFRDNRASYGGGVFVKGLSRSGSTFYGELYLRGNTFSGNSGGSCAIGEYGELREDRNNRYGDSGCRYR